MGYKITGFIIGLLIFSAIAGIFGIFISYLGKEYAPTDYTENNATLASYNKLTQLSQDMELIQNGTTEIKEKSGVFDVIGSYFSDAYRTMIITKNSFDVYDELSSQAFSDATLGEGGAILRVLFTTIILVCVFIGVFLSAVVKWNL